MIKINALFTNLALFDFSVPILWNVSAFWRNDIRLQFHNFRICFDNNKDSQYP